MQPTTPTRLLLIEDNPGDARLLRELLDRRHFQLEHRPLLKAGLQLLEQQPIDLALLDLGLPDSQGLEGVRLLREQAPQIPIVVLTGNSDEQMALEALQGGAQDYLVKGEFDEKLLQRSIRYALERQKIETELTWAKKEWQDTFESLNDMVTVHDADFNILLCNRAARSELGTCTGVEGRKLKCHQFYHGLDAPPPECVSCAAAASGQPSSAEFFEPHLNKFIEVRAIPRLNEQGVLVGAIHIVRDISQRKRAEESEQRNHKLSQALTEATLHFLKSGDIQQMVQIMVRRSVDITGATLGFLYDLDHQDSARLLALYETRPDQERNLFQDLLKNVLPTMPKSHRLMFAPVFQRTTVLTNNAEGNEFCEQTLPKNHPRIQSFLATPLFIGSDIVGVLGLANKPGGFTEREQVEVEAFAQTVALALQNARIELARQTAIEHLRQSQKMEAVGQLAGGIAHDFNNLLTVIQGYGTLLIRNLQDRETQQNDARTILKASERAAELVRGLLAFSRRQVFEPRVLDLNELIHSTEKMLRRLIREDIRIELDLSSLTPRIWADPIQIEQILMNLVVNARDAITGSGRIVIATSLSVMDNAFVTTRDGARIGTYARLSVSDNGCGMAEDVRQKVFEPFYTTKEQGKGTGLGLSTAYGIVKQSGGYIEVESNPGAGSTFIIYLPMTERQQSRLDSRPTPTLAYGKKTVLLVEDEPTVLQLTSQLLGSLGFKVIEANSSDQALRVMENSAPEIDLLLTDVVMPGMNGIQLAKQLNQLHPGLKVLFMSGYSEEAISSPEEITEGRHFIQKPFSLESLNAKLLGVFSPP